MIIDISYFERGFLVITGISATGTGVAVQVARSKKDNINYFIAEYEPKYLRLLLGEKLANTFMDEITKDVHDSKWDDLKNKLISSVTIGTTVYKSSPIADYIYFYYQRNEITDTTTTGEYDAPQLQTIRNKQINAWNDMVEKSLTFFDWMEDNLTVYPEFSYDGCFDYINSFGI